MKYTQTNTRTHPQNSSVNQKCNLPGQISFVLYLDEAINIIQAFATVNLNETTATIRNSL